MSWALGIFSVNSCSSEVYIFGLIVSWGSVLWVESPLVFTGLVTPRISQTSFPFSSLSGVEVGRQRLQSSKGRSVLLPGFLWAIVHNAQGFRIFWFILRFCLRRTEHIFSEQSKTYCHMGLKTKRLWWENGKEGGIRHFLAYI